MKHLNRCQTKMAGMRYSPRLPCRAISILKRLPKPGFREYHYELLPDTFEKLTESSARGIPGSLGSLERGDQQGIDGAAVSRKGASEPETV
jgi:hypothetical protein